MSAWQRWLHHPEKVWVRKCFFYIHLWVGAGISMYIVLMSITGCMIVYRNELERAPTLVSSVEWVVDFHENLLFGPAGRFANWRRALAVNWNSHLGRLSWDTHSALGFWCFLFVLMWGISGLYFAFPRLYNVLFGVLAPGDSFTDDTLLWLSNLHFGMFNRFSKALWVLLGLAPAALSVTGVFLCCRRMICGSPQTHGANPGE